MQELPSILAALAVFGLLVLIRVKVMEFRVRATGGHFSFGRSLHMLLRVLSSLAVPGLGQAMRGSVFTGFAHLTIFVVALCCVGSAAFLINLASAMEHPLTR
jgi:hypothetical protein